MPYAARMGDNTAHGTPLTPGPGSMDVFIGGKGAWRAQIDTHTCPLSDGPKPHVGGVVALGSKSVSINGFQAARVGDKIVEAGAPNPILMGELKVNIGG